MPDDLEQLQRKLEEGLAAIREVKRLKAEEQRRDRPKLKLVRGGLIGAGIWSGVEWLWTYKTAVTVAAAAVTFTGGIIAEQPHSPGSDPPQAIKPPASVRPSVPARPTTTPTRPPRTSPLRAPVRSSTPVVAPAASPTRTPKPSPAKTPRKTPSVSPTELVTTTLIETPTLVSPATTCTINLLGVELCLPLG